MEKYTGIVSEEFIVRRDKLAASLAKKQWWIKNFNSFLLRADYEMPEWHTPEYETLKETFGMDATHAIHGVTDFKHMHKLSGNVSISLWAQGQRFDNYVLWDWVENSKYKNKLALEAGDEVSWEIIDIVPKESVNKEIKNQTQYNYYNHIKLRR